MEHAAWRGVGATDCALGVVQLREQALAILQVARAGIRQPYLARRAREQLPTQVCLEMHHGARDYWWRQAQATRRAGKAPRLSDGDKRLHGGEAVHVLFLFQEWFLVNQHDCCNLRERSSCCA